MQLPQTFYPTNLLHLAKTLKFNNRVGLVISLVSAFFIVFIVGLSLTYATKVLGYQSPAKSVYNASEEPVAFQPGQYVTREISRGYLSH